MAKNKNPEKDTTKKSDLSANASNKWSRKRRIEFIDFRLSIDGKINRADLVDFFWYFYSSSIFRSILL